MQIITMLVQENLSVLLQQDLMGIHTKKSDKVNNINLKIWRHNFDPISYFSLLLSFTLVSTQLRWEVVRIGKYLSALNI